jgi:hypothetical protein
MHVECFDFLVVHFAAMSITPEYAQLPPELRHELEEYIGRYRQKQQKAKQRQ